MFLVGRLGCCSTKKLGIWLKLESLLFKIAGAGEKNFGAGQKRNGSATLLVTKIQLDSSGSGS